MNNSLRVILTLAFALVSSAVMAEGLPTNLQAQFWGTDNTDGQIDWMMNPTLNVDSLTGVFNPVTATNLSVGTFTLEEILVTGNVDPVVSAGFTVTNNTGVTQNYIFNFMIPIVAQTPSTVTGGSTGVTITDTNGDGVTLAGHVNGRPTYFSQIDGVDHEPLSLTPLSAGAFSTNSTNTDFGQPIPSFPGPAALNTISIEYNFSLTAGDRAAFTGVFVVEAIPEPSSALLVATLLVPAMFAGRRS